MRFLSKISFVLCTVLAVALPFFVFAQVNLNLAIPGAQVVSTNNPCSTVINFYWFALLISGVLAFGAIVYGGITYALAAGNPSGQTEGKDWIKGALLGVLLLASSYLILNLINPALVKCQIPELSPLPAISGAGAGTGSSSYSGGGGTFGGGGAGGQYGGGAAPAAIANAAATYQNADTSAGPACPPSSAYQGPGSCACAWAVNNVLRSAGDAPLDTNSVQGLENALNSGRGTLVNQSAAVPGDIVVQGQDRHVGICMNNGCTQVISNSSSHASFSRISNTNFNSGVASRIYQVNN